MQLSKTSSRRHFLQIGAASLAGAAAVPSRAFSQPPAAGKKLFTAMGIAAAIDKAAVLKAAGAEFLVETVTAFLVPDQPESAFEKILGKLAASPLPVLACNGFIRPAHLHCVGADANHDRVLEWAEIVFRRMNQAGGKFIVFGSAGARQLRDGWPKEKADGQFTALLKQLGPLAATHGITVTLEQLQAKECNYINRIGEGAALVRAAGHPNIRLLADLYHMAHAGDTPADLKAALDVVTHIEIAEKADRTVPGVAGDDFRPFFQVLREGGYQGAVSIEGTWTDEQVAPAFEDITQQAASI